MARLPEASDLMRRQQGAPRRVARVGNGASIGEAVAGFGDTVGRIVERRADEAASYELSEARSRYLRESIAAENDMRENAPWATWGEDYAKRTEDLAGVIGGGLNDPRAKAEFTAWATDQQTRRGQAVYLDMRERRADQGRASLSQTINDNLDAALSLPAGPQRDELLNLSAQSIDGAVGEGFISAERGVNLRRAAAETFAKRAFAMMPPEQRLSALGGAPVGSLSPEIASLVAGAARDAGVDPTMMLTIAMLESSGNPAASNPSGAKGLMQLMPPTAAQYGVADPFDAGGSARGGARLAADNIGVLAQKLGRRPDGWEVYLAHQQGAGGAAALLVDPEANALDALSKAYDGDRKKARAALRQNGGDPNMTAGEFAWLWRSRYAAAEGRASLGAPDRNLISVLPPDEVEAMRDTARRQVESDRFAAERAYAAGFSDYLGAVQSGAAVSPDLANRYSDPMLNAMVSDPAQRRIMAAARDDAVRMADYSDRVRFASPAEINDIAGELATDAGAVVTDEAGAQIATSRAKDMVALRSAVTARNKALLADPAAFVLSQPQMQDAAQGDPAQFAGRIMAEQERLGVPERARRVLTKAQADDMRAEFETMAPDQIGPKVLELRAAWGSHADQVEREIMKGGLPPATRFAAAYADDPILSKRIALLRDTDAKALAEGLPKTDVTDLADDVDDGLAEFRSAFEAGSNGVGVGEFNDFASVAHGLALQEFRRTGDASAAVENTINGMVNARYSIAKEHRGITGGANVNAYVPIAYDPGDVEDAAAGMLSDARLIEFNPVVTPSGDPALDDAATMRASARNGLWVTNATGDGLELMVEYNGVFVPLVNAKGERYGFKFKHAMMVADDWRTGKLDDPQRLRGDR